tara:strand:- start:177 stop:701 length:525 start_codon:yes stop_codon:yes gene_type:complete
MKKGNNTFISDKARIINSENLTIGHNCKIDDNCLIICKSKVKIGNYVHIGTNSILRAHKNITIKDYALISSFTDIYTESNYLNDNSFSHPLFMKKSSSNKALSKELIIEKYSQLGSHSVILPGAKIEEGAIVGALTLINFKTKKWTIYHGNPAKIIGTRNGKLIQKYFNKNNVE